MTIIDDTSRIEMRLGAAMLSAGADVVHTPHWLGEAARGAVDAIPACPHTRSGVLDVSMLPVYYYQATGEIRCARCAVDPEPVCAVCGEHTLRAYAALHGVTLTVVGLCDDHPDLV